MKTNCTKAGLWGALAALLILTSVGCGKAPVANSQNVGPSPQLTDKRIEAIQNDASLSPDAKQKAIAILKSREAPAPAAPAP